MKPCLLVDKSAGEVFRKKLHQLSLLDNHYKIRRINDKIAFPLKAPPTQELLAELKKLGDFVLSSMEFEELRRKPRDLIEALGDVLTPFELSLLPRSFDVVGDIAIVELPDELLHVKEKVGKALLTIYDNVKAVYMKYGKVNGAYRIRPLEHIAGEAKTETVHKEYGCFFKLDVMKVYFSPRLSWEHWRIASQVKKGEVVVDMFAGVGPFSIMIAKKVRGVMIYAIDINPDAIKYLKENIKLNSVENSVIPMLGDAKDVIETQLRGVADRVIMNLPSDSIKFVQVACKALKENGGIIHYYAFASEDKTFKDVEEEFIVEVSRSGRSVKNILFKRIVRAVAPRTWQVVLDAFIA
ncbi:MAG: hypothetical protein DRJ33_08565 [Candidatus Methanomethylicota archaeon]|uniref:tRNA (guanine(37)-N(1))-methyltransferase Trm5b n=1 Tax=Thermoproteota archaeon TaxID=2056631 RepID=A0A497ENZ2_9CREN|nr:MAG: hypothetical protein DRJ33_08565 [Candidatus Verstraetearchaeota archaeon]